MATPVETCPAHIQIEINPNSKAANFFRKWPTGIAISHGKIMCPAVARSVEINVSRQGSGEIVLRCIELACGKCNFQAE